MKKLLITSLLILTALIQSLANAGPFVNGQVLTAQQLNSFYDATCFNASCALTGGSITGVSINNTPLGASTPAAIYFTETVNVTAAGSTQGTATALTSQFNKITTSGTGTGVVLSVPARSGYTVYVENATNYFVNLYPQVGATIDTLAVNTPIVIPPGGVQQVTANSTVAWDTFDSMGGPAVSIQSSSSVYSRVYKNYIASPQGAQIQFYHDRGTPASSVSITANDGLGNIDFFGFNGASAVEGAGIDINVLNNWTVSSNDAYLVFYTTLPNATVPSPTFYMYASGAVSTAGINSTGQFTQTYTDGTVIDYATGNGRISVGAGDALTLYNGGIANTLMAQFTAGGLTVGSGAGGFVSHRYDNIAASGRAVNTGAASDTIAASTATTFESNNTGSGAFTVTLAAPVGDGERRRICFKNVTGTITWAVTAPATTTNGLPTTMAAGQCVEVVYNSVAGSPANSTATTWYVY